MQKKNNCLYFVEVKYRKSDQQGRGLDYITPKKLKQMGFAAEVWVNNYNWENEYQLAAIEISDDDFNITAFIVDL